MRLAVFASGSGTNFEAIYTICHCQTHVLDLALLFCDQPGAGVCERAKRFGVPMEVFSPKNFETRADYEKALVDMCKKHAIDLVALAGYMRIIHKPMLDAFPQKIINIHPALLPAFPGATAIADAFHAGAKISGVTVHYIDEGIDTGAIINQVEVPRFQNDTLESFEARIHEAEHLLYPSVLIQLACKSTACM